MQNIPRLRDIRSNSNQKHRELTSITNNRNGFKEWREKFFNLENILKLERIFDLVLKLIIVGFIGFVLYKQISFVNDLILKIGSGKLVISDLTIQIFITGTIIEFILGIKIIINSLFPEGDRKNSLDFMQGKLSKDEKPIENEGCAQQNQ
ncbi:MAG: hypothetical protein ACRCX2_18740 [Paraclostridium sp.]